MEFWLITLTVLVVMSGNLLLRAGMLALQDTAIGQRSPRLLLAGAFQNWRVVLGMLLVSIGLVAWMMSALIWRMEWSYIALGLSYVATVVLAWWFIGETMTLEKMFGAIIIVIGTLLIIRNSGF
jgi:drug/metabolite transporter (DMT)-like permease